MTSARPSWPRRLRRLCLFLVLGLVTTVGVAWWLAAFDTYSKGATLKQVHGLMPASRSLPARSLISRLHFGFGRVTREWWTDNSPRRSNWVADRFYEAGHERLLIHAWTAPGSAHWGDLPETQVRFAAGFPVQGGSDEALGWPSLALWRGLGAFAFPGLPVPDGTIPGVSGKIELPVRPIWPGLAFNTLFYALLWWLAFASARSVRQRRRYRRGLCPVCRYDLRADYSQGCSECGWNRA